MQHSVIPNAACLSVDVICGVPHGFPAGWRVRAQKRAPAIPHPLLALECHLLPMLFLLLLLCMLGGFSLFLVQ